MLNIGRGLGEWEEEGKRKWKETERDKNRDVKAHGERLVIIEYLVFFWQSLILNLIYDCSIDLSVTG